MPKSGERIGMNIIVYKKESDERVPSLWDGICRILPGLKRKDSPVVLAVTGAGGNIVHCRPGTGTGRKGETDPRRDDDSYVPAGTVWRIDR